MTFGLTGSAAAMIGAAAIGAVASNSASNRQASAARDAAGMQMGQYNQTREDQAQYREAGSRALDIMSAGLGPNGQFGHQFDANDLNANLAPNYEFMLRQGQGATQNSAAVGGGLVGGNTLKAIQDYTQNYAGNAYQQAFNNYSANQTNIYNRLASIAQLGQTSATQTGGMGANAAGAAGGYLTSGAAANAAGLVGGANAVNNGISNYMGWQYLNGGGGGGGGSPSNADIERQIGLQ